MIKAVIFDMDGVLLDSEPFWHEAEIEVFATVGIHLTKKQCIEMMGLPTSDIVKLLYSKKAWNTKSQEQVTQEILDHVHKSILDKAILLDGVIDVIELFLSNRIPLALATSSPQRLIDAVLTKLQLTDMFSVVHSAENETYAKPHPAVFLTTAYKLKIDPIHCLVIEDSFNGLIAAKAARMKTLAIPMAEQFDETRFDIADMKLRSLKEFGEEHWNNLNTLT
jgi:sugar-phosphatase